MNNYYINYILNMYNNPKIKYAYIFLYGRPIMTTIDNYWTFDTLVRIPKEKVIIEEDKDYFIYCCKLGGKDNENFYEFSDYGKTWFFEDKPFKGNYINYEE